MQTIEMLQADKSRVETGTEVSTHTPSQAAFTTWFRANYSFYYDTPPIAVKAAWKKGEAYGRKQALEDALAICNVTCDPHNTEHGNGYNRGALDYEKKIKELLK